MKKYALLILILATTAAVTTAWMLRPRTVRVYTDGETIRESTDRVEPRDVLWQPPTRLPDTINSTIDDYEPRISADESTLFFVRGQAGQNADILFTERTIDGWSEPKPVNGINTEYEELGPQPSADGKSLYFYSDRLGGEGGYDLWVAHQGPSGWHEPLNLGPNINSPFNEYGPALSPDDGVLYFASNRPRPDDGRQPDPEAWPATVREDLFHRDYDLYAAVLTGAGPGEAEAIRALNTPYNDGAPAVSPFGDFLYFASDRPGGAGGFDLYRARRFDGKHIDVENLGVTVNTPANELDAGLLMGGFGLYFSSDRSATASDGPTVERNRYDIFYSASREVFVQSETAAPGIDWAGWWDAIGINLLWLLLLLLAALALLALWREARDRRLSLLVKCLLLSLLTHLMLLLLFAFWEVSAGIADSLRHGGGTRVVLASPVQAGEITGQIRGRLTDVETPEFAETTDTRVEHELNHDAPASTVQLTVDRAPIDFSKRIETDASARESAPAIDLADARTAMLENDHRPTEPAKPVDLVLPSEGDRNTVSETVESDRPIADIPASRSAVRAAEPVQPIDSTRSPEAIIDRSRIEPDVPFTDTVASREAPAPPAMPTIATVSAQAPLSRWKNDFRIPNANQAEPRIAQTEPEAGVTATASPDSPRSPALSASNEAHVTIPMAAVAPVSPSGTNEQETSVANWPDALADAQTAAPWHIPLPKKDATDPAANIQLDLPEAISNVERAMADGAQPSHSVAKRFDSVRMDSPVLDLTDTPPPSQVHIDSAIRPANPTAADTSLVDALPEDVVAHASFAPSPMLSESLLRVRDINEPAQPADSAIFDGLRLPQETFAHDNPFALRQPEKREQTLEEIGGNDQTEEAVRRALIWLANHQSPDGRWDSAEFDATCDQCDAPSEIDVDVTTTGLATLAFLGAHHTHIDDGRYAQTVSRALDWLLEHQADDGNLGDSESMYSHGIAALALAEAFAMTGDVRLLHPLRRAVAFIDSSRNRRTGGWGIALDQSADTSVTGWQALALHCARAGGIDVPFASFQSARDWLKNAAAGRHGGLYAYEPGSTPTAGMTAEGLFAQSLLGRSPTDRRTHEAVSFIMDRLPEWETSADTYYWHFATLALHQIKGPAWQRWNDALTRELLAHQHKDQKRSGSWDPSDEWSGVHGRVYQTALNTLTLETYYRYPPMQAQPDMEDAMGVVRGRVTDADTGQLLYGAVVRLNLPGEEPLEVRSARDGVYILFTPEVPDYFALSAYHEGYVPRTANISAADVEGRTFEVDFALDPAREDIIAIETVPDVHHLGNDRFEGRVNSQFQKESEGRVYEATFTVPAEPLQSGNAPAELRIMTKGVQCPHRIYFNGRRFETLQESPRDGSFGEFAIPFDIALLHAGPNVIVIEAVSCRGDLDDFEFVNPRIHIAP